MAELESILIEEAKQDSRAFGELVLRYQDRLFNFLYRMTGNREDAQDLAQEVFLRVYKALHRFRPDAPFRPWLYKIAMNLAINHAKGRRPTALLEEDVPSHGPLASPEGTAEQRETQQAIRQAILELPEVYRAVILLRHVDELSYEEMAQVLEVPLGTAKVRLHRARSLLQEKLREAGIKGGDHELQHRATAHPTLPG
ncbi:MAG: sigma-70 family RNA polymerase sigma factor [Chloroflexi bacterium]|nr:sigma-70 family RNA polymerase sigma factor [Chloroflexota bacterium]